MNRNDLEQRRITDRELVRRFNELGLRDDRQPDEGLSANKPEIKDKVASKSKITFEQHSEFAEESKNHPRIKSTKSDEKRRRYSEEYTKKTKETLSANANSTVKPLELQPKSDFKISRKNPAKPKMITSSSENSLTMSLKEKVKIAHYYISSLATILKEVKEKQAVIFDRESGGFRITNIKNTKNAEIEKCVKKILAKIKLAADYELNDIGAEGNINTSEIIAYLENADWSRPFFEKNTKSQLAVDLELTKKAVEQVKVQSLIQQERASTNLVGLLFKGELEDAEPLHRLTLDDLSLVYPMIMTFERLLQKVVEVLSLLQINSNSRRVVEQAKEDLLKFCIKCMENEVGLHNYPEFQIENIIELIGKFASKKVKNELSEAYLKTAQAALMAVSLNWRDSCQAESIIEINEKQDFNGNVGCYGSYLEALRQKNDFGISEKSHIDASIISSIAKGIVKKTASEFIKVPLDELLSGKLDKAEVCPHFKRLIDSVESLSKMVESDIQLYADKKVVLFYLDLINECISLGDFASAFSLYVPVSLLKQNWDNGIISTLETLNNLFDQAYNYKNLRCAMKKCTSDFFTKPPFLFSKDLTFFKEVPTIDEKKQINQAKLRCISREVMLPFQRIQRNLFRVINLEADPA